MDRRTTIKWILAASASMPFLDGRAAATTALASGDAGRAKPYGTDPDVLRTYQPGELWPLTLTAAQRRTATALCDVIMPEDAYSPSASSVGVVDFIDEWISAPYSAQQADRALLLEGLHWIDQEALVRFHRAFDTLRLDEQRVICDDISYLPKADAVHSPAALFFARFRDLTAGGFYTTMVGRKDLQYVGNTPTLTFDGPPLEVLRKVGLA